MSLSRRQLLEALGLAPFAGVPLIARQADAGLSRLRAPVLSDDLVVRSVAGIRPFRKGGPCLQRQEVAGKILVHNYGHGGAGYTVSWGSALQASNLLRDVPRVASGVAVLGAGVIGLSTARVLQERGFRVRIYARDFPPHTTSDVAGAEWSPDLVDRGADAADRKRFDEMLVQSWHRFSALVGPTWGVTPRPIYEAENVASGLDDLPAGLLPPARRLASLPFAPARSGRVYRTLLIEAPIYLAKLAAEVRHAAGVFERRVLTSLDELHRVPEAVAVNCLGLGAGELFADRAVVPIRGQLVHLKPQALPYLLDHPDGYVVPRQDVLVLGGTFEVGIAEPRTDPATCQRILDDNRRFFAG